MSRNTEGVVRTGSDRVQVHFLSLEASRRITSRTPGSAWELHNMNWFPNKPHSGGVFDFKTAPLPLVGRYGGSDNFNRSN